MLAGREYRDRAGLLLELRDTDGRGGWGDCAPLPGFSRETLDEAKQQLVNCLEWLTGLDPDISWVGIEHAIHSDIENRRLVPSARFAVELALLDLVSARTGRSLSQLLHPDPAVTVPVNALITEDLESIETSAERAVREGYRVLKLKVGRKEIEDDVARVRAARLAVGPNVAIRCDANQAWTFSEASRFAEGIAGLGVEYVEEPLQEPSELPLLWFDTHLPVALDESLLKLEPRDLEGKGFATAVVLKPTLLGGIIRTMRFARAARAVGVRSVISSAVESGVAMRAHVAMAAATGAEPAGLDPYNLLETDVLKERLRIGPAIDVPAMFAQPVSVAGGVLDGGASTG